MIQTFEHAESAHFLGHFPNNPILPGVVQILRAESAYRARHPDAAALTKLSRIKFLNIIRPNTITELQLNTEQTEQGVCDFLHRQGELVCARGRLVFGLVNLVGERTIPTWAHTRAELTLLQSTLPQSTLPQSTLPQSTLPQNNAAFERFMPHRSPMLWLDRMLMHTDTQVVAERTLRLDGIGIVDGVASNAIALELFAQTASAHFGFLAMQKGGDPNGGAFLGSRTTEFFATSLPIDKPLRIACEMNLALPPLAQFSCWLYADELLAVASINVAVGMG